MARDPNMNSLNERRAEPRTYVNEDGLIALDEHTSIGCLVHDLSASGVRVTSLKAREIPAIFYLTMPHLNASKVCSVVWRTDEMIGATFQ